MAELDPLTTSRDVAKSVAAELGARGFEDVQEIGRGGFGVVYRCGQTSLDRTVAVKVLTSDLGEVELARFVREQRAMGRLSGHPNIANIFEIGTLESNRPFIVMQYHPQKSLEARIRDDGPLGWPAALRLGVKVAGALETAHRMGILHRDVKPANILLTDYDEPQLTDFGIAHISGGFETDTGTVTGSPAFTSPEVLTGGPPTVASDVYSLGATLFCAITGHAAFERRRGEHLVTQFLRIATEPVPELDGRHIPHDVRAVVERAMAGDVAERPATAEELGNLLREAERRNNLSVDDMAFPTEKAFDVEAPVNVSSRDDPKDTALEVFPVPVRVRIGPMALAIRGKDGNLPLELTSFVGRRHELSEAKRLLSVSRLLTLTGIGGVGKTRIALRMGADARRAFDHGVWLIELAEISDPARLVDTVAAALGIRERSVRPPLELVAEFIAEHHLLLILDNCEHLVETVAAVVEPLLRNCPELRILVTSRETLNIGGEVVMRVSPLAVPNPGSSLPGRGISNCEAIALFTDRAHTAVPEFELTDDNRSTIVQICQRLDGLPLPIELAAVQLRTMSATQILDRLTDRFVLLTGVHRGAPSRQQTLRLSVDWSYGLCTAEQQKLWERLSVFSGGFGLDAVEGVCAGNGNSDELLETVASLVDKSILIREQPGTVVRFRMLETLREYGREKLQANAEYTILRRRHRDWYQQLVLRAEAEWITVRQVEWIARLQLEKLNIGEALEFCVADCNQAGQGIDMTRALHAFWFTRGLYTEGRRWIDRVLADNCEPSAARIETLCNRCMMAGLQGDARGAAQMAEARDLAERLGGVDAHSCIVLVEGTVALYAGEPARAISCFDEVLDRLRAESRPIRLLEALTGNGLASWLLGDYARAVASHEEVLKITKHCGESVYRTYSLWGLGLVVWRQGNLTRAVQLFEEGVRVARRVDDPVSAALCIEALAWVAGEQHSEGRAAELMGAARALRRAVGGLTVHIPAIVQYHRTCEEQVRDRLGKRAYQAAFEQGNSRSFGEAVGYVLDEMPRAQTCDDGGPALTRREKQVAELVSAGMTNRAIAAKLVISHRTAAGHVEHILTKLGFTSRAQIASWYAEHKVGNVPI